MLRTLIVIAGLALARDAHADAKTQKLASGYQREARNCKIQSDGVTKVLDGATAMHAEIDDDGLEIDITNLRTAQQPIQAFCSELAAVIELLNADRNATYKSLEPQLIERDKKLRDMRKAFKQAANGVTPIIRRLVPRINKRAAASAHSTPKTEPPPTTTTSTAATTPTPPPVVKTPVAPPAPAVKAVPPAPAVKVPPPAPVVKMIDGPTTSLAVRSFTGGTCDDQAKQSGMKAEALEREPKKAVAGAIAWIPGTRWRTSYVSGARLIQIECVQNKAGGFILTLEGPNAPRPDRELLEVAARALTATAKR